jgi:hypothetical protein
MRDRTEVIRKLNDDLRVRGMGGRMVVTAGIAALRDHTLRKILQLVASFDGFDESNDPYGEHDFGQVCADGQVVFFKLDYYDNALYLHSPDPADPRVTQRVLTIMLSSEY